MIRRRTGGLVLLYLLTVRVLFIACVLIAAFTIVGFATGWIEIQRGRQTTTIEVDTRKVKAAAADAVEAGKDLIEEAGEELQEIGDEDKPAT
jgi:hypothetical protein